MDQTILKNMKRTLLTLMAAFSLTMGDTSKAALGWTLTDCLNHWGPIVKCIRDNERFLFNFDYKDYVIGVALLHDKVSRVGYGKVDNTHSLIGLSFEEIRSLLNANGNGKSWEEPVKDEASKEVRYTWKNPDGLWAIYYPDAKTLIIFTDEDNSRVKENQAKEVSDL
jgi:hypothetical protein